MNIKKISTVILLLLVIASISAIISKEFGATSRTEAPVAQITESIPAKVVAYYFHGNVRCTTCRKIETLTKEAIQGAFAQDIQHGRIELRVVNLEEPGNEHFVKDYQLATRSVVIARFDGQEQKDWKRLDEVWQLVSDRDAFVSFVRGETAALLKVTRS